MLVDKDLTGLGEDVGFGELVEAAAENKENSPAGSAKNSDRKYRMHR